MPPSSSPQSEFWAGVRAEAPILLGVIPFGLIYGVLAISAGLSPLLAVAMSSIVFAGSSQVIGVQLIGSGTPGFVIVLTTLVVNLRHMLYSASTAPHIQHLSARWKWALAYLLTDEAYAVGITRYNQADVTPHKHWYFLGAGITLWSAWQLSSAAGVWLAWQLNSAADAGMSTIWALDFTLPLTFIALVFPALRDKASIASALAAGAVAILAAGLPLKLGLMAAALTGIMVGLLIETK